MLDAPGGVRVGFMGLVEPEWIDTLPDPPESMEYTDFQQCARATAKELRASGCHVVVAITHMREVTDAWSNDGRGSRGGGG